MAIQGPIPMDFGTPFPTACTRRGSSSRCGTSTGVLGDGARDRGALADQISPLPGVGAGLAYVRLETSPDPVRGRAAYMTDADMEAMAALVAAGGEAA